MIGTELLDDPRADPIAVATELRDIARLNLLFGGTNAVVGALNAVFRAARDAGPEPRNARWTLLDIGTGAGDIPRAAVAAARRHGIRLTALGVEVIPAAARLAHGGGGMAVVIADAAALPFAPGSVDIVVASQVLHHLPRAAAIRWIATFDRLARRAVVLADLRRSRIAMAGVWAACLGLGMNRVTRHDAVLSVRRGYTRREFSAMLAAAGVAAVPRYRPGFRIVASWEPKASSVIRHPSHRITDDGQRMTRVMHTVDRIAIQAPIDRVFDVAADVERWPDILSHYRWVRFLERRNGGGGGTVEMAAWRPFGPLRYPTWWISDMTIDRAAREIRYRHMRGITAGMDVTWRLAATGEGGGVDVTILHEWAGPAWPLVGGPAARLVIGPVFIHGIASRTLAGIKREAERT